jgi:hypothetical protein
MYIKLKEYADRVCKQSTKVLASLPDRTKIFLSALWFWTYIMFYLTKVTYRILGFILTYTPNSLIIYKPFNIISHEAPIPKIIEARHDTEDITNKLRALVGLIWDSDINNDEDDTQEIFGGINIKDILNLYPMASTSVIWISYLFEIDKKLHEMNDEELGKGLKYLLINFADKSLYRTSNISDKEKAIFGEIPF